MIFLLLLSIAVFSSQRFTQENIELKDIESAVTDLKLQSLLSRFKSIIGNPHFWLDDEDQIADNVFDEDEQLPELGIADSELPVCSWKKHTGRYCKGYISADWPRRSVKSLSQCQRSCASIPTCKAITVGTYGGARNQCVMCTSASSTRQSYTNAYVKSCKLPVPRPRMCSWKKHTGRYCKGYNSADWPRRAVKTLSQCQRSCAAISTCKAITVGTYGGARNQCVMCTSARSTRYHYTTTYVNSCKLPTTVPTPLPTTVPTPSPTTVPTPSPTTVLTPSPTTVPSPSPTTVPTPSPTMVRINCETSQWIKPPCSKTCGKGKSIWTRKITTEPKGNGKECPPLTKVKDCNKEKCPIDCVISQWKKPPCSKTCGKGQSIWTREVTRKREGNGKECPSQLIQVEECNKGSCRKIALEELSKGTLNSNYCPAKSFKLSESECRKVESMRVDVFWGGVNSGSGCFEAINRKGEYYLQFGPPQNVLMYQSICTTTPITSSEP